MGRSLNSPTARIASLYRCIAVALLWGGCGSLGAQPLADITELFSSTAESMEAAEREAFGLLVGGGRPVDYERALPLLERAAAAGRPTSIVGLADMYWFGVGVDEDRNRAFDLYLQAAQLGNAQAQFFLGYAYDAGVVVERDLAEAVRWNEVAASQGHPGALARLAHIYGTGHGVAADDDVGFELLNRAAELGDPAALRTAGFRLMRDPERLDPERGIRFLERIAADDDYAAFEIGWAHLTGRIALPDLREGARWIMQSATSGNPLSKIAMAQLLEHGIGVDRNVSLAESMRETALEAASPSEKNAIAWSLSTSQHAFARNGPLAVTVMEELLALPDTASAAWLDTLAAAYAESGRFDEAIETQMRAIAALREAISDASETAGQSDGSLSGMTARLELYRSGQLYRLDD